MIFQEVKKLTAKEIFNATKEHLLEQQETSYWDHVPDTCAYHTTNQDGKPIACAIGFRIPDKIYHEDLEDQSVMDLIEAEPTFTFLLPTDLPDKIGESFLHSLQQLHDQISVENWPEAFNILEAYWFDGETVNEPALPIVGNFFTHSLTAFRALYKDTSTGD